MIGGFILFWVYRDFAKAGYVLLHGVNWWWMLFSLAFGVFSHIIRGWRWKMTLEPLGAFPKTGDCVNAIFVSYAANLVLPRVGEISRCGVLAKYDDISFYKIFGYGSYGAFGRCRMYGIYYRDYFFVALVFLSFFKETGTKIPSIVHLLTSVWFYIVLFYRCYCSSLLFNAGIVFFEKVKGIVFNVYEGVMSLKNVKNIPLFVLYTVLIWLCYFLHFYITFYCLVLPSI